MFPPGLENLNRNPGESHGVGSIPLKSIVIFKRVQRTAEMSFRTGSRSRSESTDEIALLKAAYIWSIGLRLMIPFTGENGQGEGR